MALVNAWTSARYNYFMAAKTVKSFLTAPFPPFQRLLSHLSPFRCVPPSSTLFPMFWGRFPPNLVWTCNGCLCGRISAETVRACPGEFQLKQEQNSSCGQDVLVRCLAERQGGSSTRQPLGLFLLFGSVLNLSSLEGETCLFECTTITVTKDFQECVLH